MSQRTRRSQAEWQALIEQQKQSGLSAAAFCREQGVLAKSFYRWRSRLQVDRDSAFVRVVPQSHVQHTPTGRILLEHGASRVMLEVCDPQWLAELLKALS